MLSICTIMRNEEDFLGEFLDSVIPFVDEMILVDTGSLDRSVEIAKSRGVEPYYFEWCNHFSKARNFALEKATGDWILVLDVDDRMLPQTFELIRANLVSIKEDAVYFPYVSLKHRNWKETISEVKAVQTRLMLFRNHKGYHYQNPVHEKIDTVIEAMGGSFAQLDSRVFHLGYADELSEQKAIRNKKLILENYADDPENPHYLHNYIALMWSADTEVYVLLKKAFSLSDQDGRYLAAQRILQWADCFGVGGMPGGEEDSHWENILLEMNPHAAYVHLRRGRKFFARQDVDNALASYEVARKGLQFELSALEDRREILDHLGVLLAMKGRFQESLECFQEIEKFEGRSAITYHQILKVLFVMGDGESFLREMAGYPGDLKTLPDAKKQELVKLVSGVLGPSQKGILDSFKVLCGMEGA